MQKAANFDISSMMFKDHPIDFFFICQSVSDTDNQALTSTRGYSLPDFLNYYPYPTRKILLPDRVVGSKEHPICPIIGKS